MKQRNTIVLFAVGIILFFNCLPTNAQQDIEWDKSISRVRMLVEKRPELLNYMDENGWTPLLKAVSMGDPKLVEYLVGKGADVNVQAEDYEKNTALHLAVKNNNEKLLRLLLSKEANPGLTDKYGRTPLYYAVKDNKKALADLLVERGARYNIFDAVSIEDIRTINKILDRNPNSVNDENDEGETPLYGALETGNHNIVKLLLFRGAKVNVRTKIHQWTPIQYELFLRSDAKNLELLIAWGANVNEEYGKDSFRESLFSHALKNDNYEQAKLLYLKGAKLIIPSYSAYKLLCMAAGKGDNKLIKHLISRGVDVNGKSYEEHNTTPLRESVLTGKLETAKILIKSGAYPNARDSDGKNSLHYIGFYDGYIKLTPDTAYKLAEMLISSGTEVNMRDYSNGTPLHKLNRYPEIVKLLIKYGADIRAKDNKGTFPIHYSAGWGKVESTKIYLDMGIDINVRDSEGRTPLHYAIHEENDENTRFLLEKGADINAQDKYGFLTRWEELNGRKWDKENRQNHGDTPIFYAFECENKEMIRILIEKGAKPDISNHVGATPMTLAADAGYEDILMLLINNGVKIDTEKNYPLHRAIIKGHTGAVEILLKNGADVNRINEKGQTPLNIVTSNYSTPWSKRFDIIDILMKNGADINKRDAYDNTSLYYAVETGDDKLVDTLLSYGANIHTVCAAGETPLTLAVKMGRYDIAKQMMKRDWTVKGFVLAILIVFLSIYGYVWWKRRRRGNKEIGITEG